MIQRRSFSCYYWRKTFLRMSGRYYLRTFTDAVSGIFFNEASAISFPSGYCSAVRGVAGSLLVMVSTVPVMIPLMVRRSASTATTLYVSLKNPVSLHPIGILMRNLGTVFPPMFKDKPALLQASHRQIELEESNFDWNAN